MGTGKKEATRRENDGLANVRTKGENFYRSAKKVKQLKMYTDGGAKYNAAGRIVKAAAYQSREIPKARIEPNRKWFNNTRVISQDTLAAFRKAVSEKKADPYQVLLHTNKLPMTLVQDDKAGPTAPSSKATIEASPFGDVFGPKANRKRAKLNTDSLSGLAEAAENDLDTYDERMEDAPEVDGDDAGAIEPIFKKGQSKRIWNELYRVLDSSDVVLHVLDARDPLGTRCQSVEAYLKKECPHKHLVFILNKTDLVPTGVVAGWVQYLSKEVPTLAVRSSITNPFGKGSLIELLRQFAKLHSGRKDISVGLVGYPNVGKSSVINMLRQKPVSPVAPIPGCTKVWQFVKLTNRINLIDCPGIVPPLNETAPQELLLRGVVRVENVEDPSQYIPAVLERVKPQHVQRTYSFKEWKDGVDFLEQLAVKSGRLLRQGEPDINAVAKMVLNDFMRGKLPWFTPVPPSATASS